MKTEVHKTAAGFLWWRDQWFWHVAVNEGYEIDAEEMAHYFDAVRRHSGGKRAPLLIDRTHSYTPAFSAFQLMSRLAPECFTAIAYYAPTKMSVAASKTVRDTFLRNIPVEIFSDEGEAIRWLRSFASTRNEAKRK